MAGDSENPLRAIGLSDLEERVYRDLLSWGGGTQAAVAASAGVPSRRAGEALASLEALALLTRSTARPARYIPTPPQSALELLVRARQEGLAAVQRTARALEEEFGATGGSGGDRQVVEVLAPGQAVGALNLHLLAGASKEILAFQLPPLTPADDQFISFKLGILARGVSVRVVYSLEALEAPTTVSFIAAVSGAGERSRVVARLPTALLIVDRQVAFLPLRSDRRGINHEYLLVHPCSVLDSLVALFEAVWADARPFDPGIMEVANGDGEGSALSAQDRQLLALLAAGLQDQTIARQWGITPRTIERRMRRIMDDLDARTRFQAAVEATRRGWLGRVEEG